MEQCVTNQDFARAAELKQQIAELEEEKEILESEENSFSQTVREEKVNFPVIVMFENKIIIKHGCLRSRNTTADR